MSDAWCIYGDGYFTTTASHTALLPQVSDRVVIQSYMYIHNGTDPNCLTTVLYVILCQTHCSIYMYTNILEWKIVETH